MSRVHTATAIAVLLASFVAPASAQDYYRGGQRVELAVIDRDAGDELPQYPFRGQAWVPGTPGHRYAVRLTNRSPERVLVVLSVDGVNAVSGLTADASQAGYVLEPWQSTDVAGWRKSMRDIAQFYFADFGDSYAARTGRPRNVGVIGIAVFDEARWIAVPRPRVYDRVGPESAESAASDAAGAPPMASARAQELGTGHGYREFAPVARTGFRRASHTPVQVTEVRYDDGAALAARGIIPHQGYGYEAPEPRAFPGGFVADPPRRW